MVEKVRTFDNDILSSFVGVKTEKNVWGHRMVSLVKNAAAKISKIVCFF